METSHKTLDFGKKILKCVLNKLMGT